MRRDRNRCRAMVRGDGYRVEPILVQRSLRRSPRPALRITWRGYHVADCTSVHEVAAVVDLAELERCRGEPTSPRLANHTTRRRVARWLLIEDVEADDFEVQQDGKQLVLYVDTLVVDEPRRVDVARLDRRDVVSVVMLQRNPRDGPGLSVTTPGRS